MKVGFIGLGRMGGSMTANLLKGGHTVKGFDLVPAALEKFQKNGGIPVSTMEEAVADADIVFTMLPNGAIVEDAVTNHIGKAMKKGALYVDSSTISPDVTIKMGKYLEQFGVRMMEAAVGRTGTDADSGTLLFMVGGEDADLEYARPCLECMGDTIIHCGKLGAGISSKVINNYMSGTLNVLTAECLAMGKYFGLNEDTLIKVLMGTTAGRGHLATTYPKKVLKGDLTPAFMVDLIYKDMGIALDCAAKMNVPLFTGASARQAYAIARAQGRGREDWTAMYEALKQMADLK